MHLSLNAQQRAFQAEVRAFIADRLPASLREHLRAGHVASKADVVAWQRVLHERGWAAPHWPREYGGADLGQMERLILIEEIQRAPAPQPSGANVMMLGPLLLRYGSEAQKRHFLPKLVSADIWFCQGFSEPEAGSDLASLRMRAVPDGNDYVLNGQKTWTSYAHVADWAFCLVRTANLGRKQEGITFVLVDLRTPGVTIRPIVGIDGEAHLNELFFTDVRVPTINRVGEEGQGWECAKFLLANERSGIAGVGLCRERLSFARELASRKFVGGRRLIDRGELRREIAWLEAEVRALEITNWRFLLAKDGMQPNSASILKVKGTTLQQNVWALLARMSGADGLRRGNVSHADPGAATTPLPMRYFQSRAFSIYGGSNEIQKDLLARAELD